MKGESSGLIVGISIGVVIGVLLAIAALFCFRIHRKRSQIGNSSSRRTATIPIRVNGADSCTILSSSSSSSRNRFDSTSSPSSMAMNSSTLVGGGGSFGWPTHDLLVDNTTKPLMDSANSHSNLHHPDHDSNLQIMGLALSSQAMDWNHTLLRSEKAENSFRNLIQDDINANAGFQLDTGISSSQDHWNSRQKIYSGTSNDDSSEFSTVTCQGLPTNYDYATNSPSMLQRLLGSEHHQSINYPYNQTDYTLTSASDHHQPWSNKMVPQYLRGSPPKQPPPQPHSPLHFSNNAPYWNAATDASNMSDVRSGFFPSLQMQSPISSNFEEKLAKNKVEVRDTTAVKKSNSESSSKRSRNEATPSTPLKVRREKMGDRVTALQQLVSPFGKTDTASVLLEAIYYIKFLHEQISILSSPYMKSGAPSQHHLHPQQVNLHDCQVVNLQGLRSRGLCLVPVSITYPVTNETTVDFWTPTFG